MSFRKSMIVASVSSALTLIAGAASAQQIGWAMSDNATAASYTPNANFQFNSAGGTNSIARPMTGLYNVKMPSVAKLNGIAHAVAYAGAHHCNVLAWGTDNVSVRCWQGNTAVDGKFVALFYSEARNASLGSGGYLLANKAADSYGPDPRYNFNSIGGTNTVKRLGTGSYELTFGQLGRIVGPGAALVTAYGGENKYCKVVGWSKQTTDIKVRVQCFNGATGAAIDAKFAASFFKSTAIGTTSPRHGAFAWAEGATSATWTPRADYSSNSTGSAISQKRLSTGSYQLMLGGLPSSNKTAAIITSYGLSGERCSVSGWTGSTTSTTLNVQCNTATGKLSDGQFTALYLTNKPKPLAIDLAATAINYRVVKALTGGCGSWCSAVVEVEGIVKNVGTQTFSSTAGAAGAYLKQEPTGGGTGSVIAQLGITSLAPGAVVRVKKQITWNKSTEFPPSFSISYVGNPDIYLDSNKADDDENPLNNYKRREGSDINRL